MADPRKVRLIKAITDGLYEALDDADAKYAKLIPQMKTAIKTLYPGKKAFQYLGEEKKGEAA